MSNKLNQSGIQLQGDYEISWIDILQFFKSSWFFAAVGGILGASLAITYLLFAPTQYQAIVKINMAQVGNFSVNLTPVATNIEEPAMLVYRYAFQSSLPPQVLAGCGLLGREPYNSKIKLIAPSGVPNIIELTTFGLSLQSARECSEAVFGAFQESHSQMVKSFLEEANIRLTLAETRLSESKSLLLKADRSRGVTGEGNIAIREEIRFLLDQIESLKNTINSSKNKPMRLLAPIDIGEVPLAPNKKITFTLGLFGGIFLGLVIAAVRKLKWHE